MNTLFMFIFLLSMIVGVVNIILLIVGLLKKSSRMKVRKSLYVVLVSLVIFFMSSYGYSATMSEEQKAELEIKKEKEAEKKLTEEKEKEQKILDEKKIEPEKKEETEKKVETVVEKEKEGISEEQKIEVKQKDSEALSNEKVVENETIPKETENTYDDLQTLFASLTFDTTIETLDETIEECGLYFTTQEYNKSGGGKSINYRIAYTEGASKQKYADSGDSVEVVFDKSNDNAFMYAVYSSDSHLGRQALYYHYGTWYKFSDANAEDYSGYYYTISVGGNDDGIVIEYTNGRKVATDYHKCESAYEAIDQVLEK